MILLQQFCYDSYQTNITASQVCQRQKVTHTLKPEKTVVIEDIGFTIPKDSQLFRKITNQFAVCLPKLPDKEY